MTPRLIGPYFLAEKKIAKEVVLVHRSSSFRGHLDSVQRVIDLADQNRIKLITEAEVTGIEGGSQLERVFIKHQKDGVIVEKRIISFHFLV